MYEGELAAAETAAQEAAHLVRAIYESEAAETYVKSDGSFVTDADLASDQVIRTHLSSAFPDDAILTEEGIDDTNRLSNNRCWIVDPIDGTNQFVERTGEFDVLISLVVDGRPVVGVMVQPTTGLMLSAATGLGAWKTDGGVRTPLRLRAVDDGSPIRLISSVWLGAPDNLEALGNVAMRLDAGPPLISKLGVTVRRLTEPKQEGDVLIGFRANGELEMAWEWDFAAADAIVTEAGGIVSDIFGRPHRYNKPLPRNQGGIILSVDPVTHQRIVTALKPELIDSTD